jgi:tRNA (guanine-N7-)-methyltransferase
MSPAQQRALDTLWSTFGIPFEPSLIDFDRVFGRRAPRVLEIGFGMGETTTAIARSRPAEDFVGIEVHPPGVGSLLKQLAEAGLTNVRVIRHDAVEVVAAMIPPGSLSGIHVFFPDPWPKKRHHKRRLLTGAFVHALALRLDRRATFTSPPTGKNMRRRCWRCSRLSRCSRTPRRLRAATGASAAHQVRDARLEARHGVRDLVFRRTALSASAG